jgi:hypothetical protein
VLSFVAPAVTVILALHPADAAMVSRRFGECYAFGSSSLGMITIRRGDLVTTGGLSSPDFVAGRVGGGIMRPLTGWPLGTAGAVTRFSAGLSLFSPAPPAPIAPGGIIGMPVIPDAPGPGGVPPAGGIDTDFAAAGVVGGEDAGTGGGPK